MKKWKKLLALTLLGSMLIQGMAQAAPLSDSAENEGLEYLAYYPLTEDVKDHSGNSEAKDAQIKGKGASFKDGALYLPGGASNSGAGYVELPRGMFDKQDTLTISVWLKNETGSGNYAALFFGQDKNANGFPTQYWLLNPAVINTGRMKSVITNSVNEGAPYNTEYGISPTNTSNGVQGPVSTSGWTMYTTVITPTTITGYYNNEKVGTVNVTNTVSNFGENLLAFIGKSSYSDPYYKGGVKELVIYKNELTDAQVAELYVNELRKEVDANLTLDAADPVKDDLTLPAEFEGAAITWSSSDESIMDNTGAITREDDDADVKSVTLTATIKIGDATITKEFTVNVAAPEIAAVDYLAYYPLKENADDESGNNKDARLKGNNGKFDNGSLYLPGGSSGSGAAYVELPKGLLNGKDTVTISVWLKNQTGSGNYAAMFFGQDKNSNGFPTQYWLLNPAVINTGRMKSVITNTNTTGKKEGAPYNTEYGISPTNSACGIPGPVTTNEWAMYTTVITPTTITGYYNDQQIGTVNINTTFKDFGNDLLGFVGKSSYSDIFYKGNVKELKIYDGALAYRQVKTDYYQEVLEMAKAELTLGDTSAVKENLALPEAAGDGVAVTWKTDNADVITADGIVTRPKEGTKAAEAELTATLSLGGSTVEKTFKVTVLPWNLENDLAEAVKALAMPTVISENIKLPTTGKYGSTITWKSGNEDVLTSDGTIVSKPAVEEGNTKVTLTATIELQGKTEKKEFEIEVMEEFYGYIMSYIRGNNDRTGSLHLAYSTDGVNFTALNSNSGVLFATIDTNNGNKNLSTGVRFNSPYLFRKADGTFGFTATQSDRLTSVYMYDSEDLFTYTGERLVETNSTVGNPLAPEVEYDTEIGAYRVNWTNAAGEKYSSITADLNKLDAATEYDYTADTSADAIVSVPEGAIAGNVIQVTKKEYDKILAKFQTVTNTGISWPEDITAKTTDTVELPETVTASYSDGSTAMMNVTWDTEGIDFSKPGTYTVNGTVDQKEYANPLIEQRADPQIKYDEERDCYYFTASYPAFWDVNHGYDRIVLRKADTIEGLGDDNGGKDKEITIWQAPSSGKMAKHVWAPEIHNIDGKWYVFFAAGNSDNIWAIRPYVLVCQGDDPYNAENWKKADGTAEIHAATSEESAYFKNMSLDMTYFEHKGHHYVIWADIIGQSALYMQEIDPAKPWTGKGKVIQLTTPEFGWERDTERVNEGATILKHGGKIFIAFSASGTGPEYCIGLLSADEDADLMDKASWTKNAYPVLTSADVPGEYGPGHNSFTVDENGNAIFVYHARSEECYNNQCEWANSNSLYDPCRHARVKRVHWAEDGTPILNMSYDNELNDAYKTVSVKVTIVEEGQEEKPTVEKVTITPDTAEVVKGQSVLFTAEVTGQNNPEQTVTWSVSGSTSDDTAITENGTLTIGADETAETLTVMAVSTVDVTKSAEAVVTVKEAEREEADKTELKNKLDSYKNIYELADSSAYTAESYQKFKEAYAGAAAVYNDPDATEAEVAEAVKSLEAAKTGLVPADNNHGNNGEDNNNNNNNNSNNNNSNNNGGKGNGKTNTTDKQVKTGDTEVPIVWGMTMLLACAAVVAIIRRKVRK